RARLGLMRLSYLLSRFTVDRTETSPPSVGARRPTRIKNLSGPLITRKRRSRPSSECRNSEALQLTRPDSSAHTAAARSVRSTLNETRPSSLNCRRLEPRVPAIQRKRDIASASSPEIQSPPLEAEACCLSGFGEAAERPLQLLCPAHFVT